MCQSGEGVQKIQFSIDVIYERPLYTHIYFLVSEQYLFVARDMEYTYRQHRYAIFMNEYEIHSRLDKNLV